MAIRSQHRDVANIYFKVYHKLLFSFVFFFNRITNGDSFTAATAVDVQTIRHQLMRFLRPKKTTAVLIYTCRVVPVRTNSM